MVEARNQQVAISGVTVIDGTGRPPLSDAVVIVEGERITAVGPRASVEIPTGEEIIDGNGRFLLPGLIDCHVHIYASEFVPVPPKGSEEAYAGVVAMNNLRSALQAGTTTVRDVSAGHINLAMRTAIERVAMLGPRCFVAGRGICMTGGHGSGEARLGTGVHEVDGPDAIRHAIREEAKAGADLIKVLTSHRSENPEYTQEELNVATEEAHRFDMKVAVHAGNYATTRMAAIAGMDTIEHGIAIDEETADMMAEKGIVLVPTLWILNDIFAETKALKAKYEQIGEYRHHPNHGWMEETLRVYTVLLDQLPKTMKIVRARDIRIAAGTDNVRASVPFAMLHKEIEYLTKYGLSPMEAIESATRMGAEAIGGQDDFGTVEAGKYADLIMVDRDPLKDITALGEVCWVMKEGNVIPLHPEWARRPIRDPLNTSLED